MHGNMNVKCSCSFMLLCEMAPPALILKISAFRSSRIFICIVWYTQSKWLFRNGDSAYSVRWEPNYYFVGRWNRPSEG